MYGVGCECGLINIYRDYFTNWVYLCLKINCMKDLTPTQKLDHVLEYLKTVQTDQFVTLERVHVDYKKNINEYITAEEIQRILYKLTADGYLWQKGVYLSITFNGLLFHGYEKQAEIEELKLKIILENENRRLRNDHRLILGTWFAGVAALLLLLWQIFLYFYPVHKDYPYFFWHK